MTRYVLIEIKSPDVWYLMQGIFNELFNCCMINTASPETESRDNPSGHLIFTGLTGHGLAYLEMNYPEEFEMYQEFMKKENLK